jgi:hypothetical protein
MAWLNSTTFSLLLGDGVLSLVSGFGRGYLFFVIGARAGKTGAGFDLDNPQDADG